MAIAIKMPMPIKILVENPGSGGESGEKSFDNISATKQDNQQCAFRTGATQTGMCSH